MLTLVNVRTADCLGRFLTGVVAATASNSIMTSESRASLDLKAVGTKLYAVYLVGRRWTPVLGACILRRATHTVGIECNGSCNSHGTMSF
jgi:hypothetical protein